MNTAATALLALTLILLTSASQPPLSIGFVSEIESHVVSFFWVHPETAAEKLVMTGLTPYDHRWISTFPGHRFVARHSENKQLLAEHVVRGDGLFVVKDPTKRFSNCSLTDPEHYQDCFADLVKPEETAESLRRRELDTKSRLEANEHQPKIVPMFTRHGFEKRRCPPGVWALVQDYYRLNRQSFARENWYSDSTVVNFWTAPTVMIHLPEIGSIKPAIFDEFRPILQEWSGVPSLVPTSMYGIRLYLNQSILENHVDRLKTHAVSAIINVDQDVDEPWPLQIYDHDGALHHIEMEPGDIVFYESARCVHGRPTHLQGKFYANFFIHFSPTDTEFWWFESDEYKRTKAWKQGVGRYT